MVLQPEQDSSDGVAIARELMDRLNVSPSQLIDTAYFDLLT